jgi:hypothetical protein
MSVKKAPVVPISSALIYRRQLETLYARRHVLNILIDSLQEYDRHQAKRIEDGKRRIA